MIVDAILAKIFGTKTEREIKAMLPGLVNRSVAIKLTRLLRF